MKSHEQIRSTVEAAYEARAQLKPGNAPAETRAAIDRAIELLNEGQLRVAQPENGGWRVNEWLKKAVLLSFRINDNEAMRAGTLNFYDKVPLKYNGWDAARFGAPYLVGNAAKILGDRWPADAQAPIQVDAQAAPDIAWVGWLGAAVSPDTAPARPYYLRAPDAQPQKDMLQKAAQPSAP